MTKVLYVTAISRTKKILTYCFLGLVALAIKIKLLNKMTAAHLEVATTKAEQEIGLSNRTELEYI